MVLRSIARHLLALLLLLAVCAPFVHAAAEFGQHDECSMEMCKRTGKCCCRQANAAKPHWDSPGACNSRGAQVATPTPLVAALLGASWAFQGLSPVTAAAPAHAVAEPGEPLAVIRFQRPPPDSL